MLIRFDPFRDLDRMAQDLWASSSSPARIPIDAVRRGDQVEIHFELPGIDPSTLDVEVEKHALTVSAERHASEEREGDEVLVRERRSGRFLRQVTLGDNLDPDRLGARYDGGVLTVTVPVAEQAKSRKVEVASGPAPAPIEAEGSQAA